MSLTLELRAGTLGCPGGLSALGRPGGLSTLGHPGGLSRVLQVFGIGGKQW